MRPPQIEVSPRRHAAEENGEGKKLSKGGRECPGWERHECLAGNQSGCGGAACKRGREFPETRKSFSELNPHQKRGHQ